MIDGFEQHKRNRLAVAQRGSDMATGKLVGMKLRAGQATPVIGHMPFAGHRTQKQVLADMTPGERRRVLA